MAASYPSSVKAFPIYVDGDTIPAVCVNDPGLEIVAIEGGLLNGLAHDLKPDASASHRSLGSGGATWYNLFLGNNATIGGTLAVTSTLTVTGASTLTGATNVAGNFSVATTKLTVAAASGNLVSAGTLAGAGSLTLSLFAGSLSPFIATLDHARADCAILGVNTNSALAEGGQVDATRPSWGLFIDTRVGGDSMSFLRVPVGGAGSATFVLQIAATAVTSLVNVIAPTFQTSTALVALGGGAPATLGTIGGSGPTVDAQNSWVLMKDSTGASFWVPVWK